MHDVNRNWIPQDEEDGNRDARLIAAAPELLSALKLYVEHFGDPLKVARSAILKAEGHQS